MQVKLHKNARTTLAIRQEIKTSKASIASLARKFSLSWASIKKCRIVESLEDKSSRPHKLNMPESNWFAKIFMLKGFEDSRIKGLFFLDSLNPRHLEPFIQILENQFCLGILTCQRF